MLAVVVIEPPTDEAGTYKDVDPEEGHEEDPVKSRWVIFKNSPKESHVTMLNPLKSLRLMSIIFLLALRLAQHYFHKKR